MNLYAYFSLAWRISLAAFCVAVILAAAAFLFPRQVLTVESGNVKADALVVLGGGDGRAERGAQLYKEGAAPLVIATGFGDCQSNIQTMERNGVPADIITPEPAARTTLQNATFSVPLLRAMRVRRAIIVTSWYHSRRALACFEHVAPDIQFYSRPTYVDFNPQSQSRTGFNRHVNYEYVKLVAYLFFHGISPL
jgi:uncharacterized SAM-binding protein YcdF (DUF218 family)